MNLKRLIWFSNYRNEKARERPLLNNELDARVLKAKQDMVGKDGRRWRRGQRGPNEQFVNCVMQRLGGFVWIFTFSQTYYK